MSNIGLIQLKLMVLCIELEYGGVGKKMLKGECGSGGGEKIKVLLRPGGGQSGQGAVCQVVCRELCPDPLV